MVLQHITKSPLLDTFFEAVTFSPSDPAEDRRRVNHTRMNDKFCSSPHHPDQFS